ncbi:zwei Ig domain protein zig-8 [Folsomia candida]|uniref:zwei Ig domain protein zig-8 n=1 Tax=Folsomia candida TaxID=158441 RepID=UPI001604EDD0|nr:zwei Ig domain protein zig-8 [Folsomia candida]
MSRSIFKSCGVTRSLLFLIIFSAASQWKPTGSVTVDDAVESTPESTHNIFSSLQSGPFSPASTGDPYFDSTVPRNVTALVGKTAYLGCRVKNLGNRTVSWVRHRDVHILTVATYTYTSDQRFQAIHSRTAHEEWILQIKYVQPRDMNMYICQISTQPHRSFYVNLNVVVPTASILGGPDLHVDKGSMINLTCIIKYSPEPPSYIFWYHYDEVINYNSERGGVSVITEKGETTTSYLLVQNAMVSDSGKYSCSPSNADVAAVRVHVLANGERTAPMSAKGSASRILDHHLLVLSILSSVLCYLLTMAHIRRRVPHSTSPSLSCSS